MRENRDHDDRAIRLFNAGDIKHLADAHAEDAVLVTLAEPSEAVPSSCVFGGEDRRAARSYRSRRPPRVNQRQAYDRLGRGSRPTTIIRRIGGPPVRAIVAMGIVAMLAACGEGPAAPTTATTWSTERATAALLDLPAVGAHWKIGNPVTAADFEDATNLPCDDVALNPVVKQRLTPVTGIQFEPVDGSYQHLIEFVVTGAPQRLDADLGGYFEALESCRDRGTGMPGGGLSVSKLETPELGDQQAAYVLVGAASAEGPTWHVRRGVVRVQSVAVEVGLTEILGSPQDQPRISDEEFVALLRAAAARVQT
jgi:hypothetical protein